MKNLLLYLLQVIIASGILYAYYHFALRNKRFHKYNRFYLLIATVVSFAVPFLNIPVYFSQADTDSSFVLQSLQKISVNVSNDPIIAITQANNSSLFFNWGNICYFLYFIIALVIFLRIILSLRKIHILIKNNPVEKLENIHFVNTVEPGTPFSFFRWLFWNKKIELRSEKGEQIFRHELFHIEQKHSRDIIYIELLTVIFWINPFFHLMKKEIKAIHEFLADKFAVTENAKWQYAELLLMQAFNTNQRLVNPFFHNQIKRRIAMITTSKKPRYQYLRKLMVFPVAAIAIGIVAFSYQQKNEVAKNVKDISSEITFSDTTKPVKIIEAKLSEQKTDDDYKNIFDKVEIEPSFPGGAAKWRQYLESNLDASVPQKNKAPDGTYTVLVQFIVDKEGNISDIRALTTHGYGMEEEARKVIIKSPKWIPAYQGSRNVNAYRRQPITFIVGKGEKKFRPATRESNDLNEIVIVDLASQKNNDKVFSKVEIPPSFPGGADKWRQYLSTNAKGSVATDSGAPAGTYKVIVQFIVHEDGTITDITTKTNHGFGMEGEAMRLIRLSPKWNPAIQNGRIVTAYVQQPITFQVSEEDNDAVSAASDIPKISIAKLKSISVYELLQLPYGTEILNYTFTIDNDAGGISQVTNAGSQFNSRTKILIANAKAGRTFSIDLIKIKENGIEKKIASIVYQVVN